jgi:hypothetical protein
MLSYCFKKIGEFELYVHTYFFVCLDKIRTIYIAFKKMADLTGQISLIMY